MLNIKNKFITLYIIKFYINIIFINIFLYKVILKINIIPYPVIIL